MILSIDIGSSSVRTLLYGAGGRFVEGSLAARQYRFQVLPGGRVEADPERLCGMVEDCIDQTLRWLAEGRAADRARGAGQGAGADDRIEAVAMATFWHSLVGVGRDGRPLTPVLTWADTRADAEVARMAGLVDAEAVRQRTGCALHPSYSPAKLSWLRRNTPDVYRATSWWATVGELCLARFLGTRVCSLSLASGTGLFDRTSMGWDTELLDVLGIEESQLSPLVDLGAPVGGLRDPWARRWPSLRDVPWLPALGDGACNSVGCGCGDAGRAAVMIGTTGALRVLQPVAPVSVPRGLWCYLLDRARLFLGGVLGDGGNLFEWMRDTLAIDLAPDALDVALLAARPAGHGLTVLPFLTGERSTGWSAARGAVLGMRVETRSIDILQAALEAVVYRFAAIRDRLEQSLPPVAGLVATGGALVRSRAWCQMLADVFDLPVIRALEPEATSRGAALLAGEALGLPVEEPRRAPEEQTFLPRPEATAAHQEARQEHERIYRLICGS